MSHDLTRDRWYLVWSWFCRASVSEGSTEAARVIDDTMTLVTHRHSEWPRWMSRLSDGLSSRLGA